MQEEVIGYKKGKKITPGRAESCDTSPGYAKLKNSPSVGVDATFKFVLRMHTLFLCNLNVH